MIQLFFREDALFEDDLADGFARRICLACELGGLLIADVGQERCHDADTVVEPLLALLDVRLQISELNILNAMTGSMTFSSNWPFSTASVTARSPAMT